MSKIKTFLGVQKTSTLLLLLVIGLVPRIILSLINQEPNDDHITPVLLWQQNGSYPQARDCWECFQPPLFYGIVYGVSAVLSLTTYDEIFSCIQFINLIFQCGIVLLIIKVVYGFELNDRLKIPLTLFFLLNPELISIGALATNDTLLILLGLSTTINFLNYLKNPSISKEIILCSLLILMGMTKGNGLLFIGILPTIIFINYIRQRHFPWQKILQQFGFMLLTVGAIAYFGNYFEKYKTYGDAFIINVDKPVESATWNTPGKIEFRKGVNTYKEAFFTFPIFDLLKNPINTNKQEGHLHRQNLWTQMLGQYSNFLFERHPPSWYNQNNDSLNFARANYVLHLLLSIFVISGLLKLVFRHKKPLSITAIFHVVSLIIFIGFVIRYAGVYRDFSFMKVLFLYPVIHSLIYMTSKGLSSWSFQKPIRMVLYCACTLYAVNFTYLALALLK